MHANVERLKTARRRRAGASTNDHCAERECGLAQASLFSALSELVNTYGEDATAKYAEGLPARIRNGEFSVRISRQ